MPIHPRSTHPTHPVRRSRALRWRACVHRALAALVTLSALGGAAHAAYPGENGVIVFDNFTSPPTISRVLPGDTKVKVLGAGSTPKASPNGRQVAYLLNGDAWVMNIDGTKPVRLTTTGAVSTVTWVRDGSRVAYTLQVRADHAQLWTVLTDGTAPLLVNPAFIFYTPGSLEWAPHADMPLFEVGGQLQYKTSPDSPQSMLAVRPDYQDAYAPSWAPSGGFFLAGNTFNSLTWTSLGGYLHPLVGEGTFTGRNAYSPDGTLIAGGILQNGQNLAVRGAVGVPFTQFWSTPARNVDWARVPRGCFTTVGGGSGVTPVGAATDYADQCVIAVRPNAAPLGGVLAQSLSLGADGRVYSRVLRNVSGATQPGVPTWGAATVVPGVDGSPDGVRALKLSIAAGRDGSFQAVIINADDQALYHAMQQPDGTWSGFLRLNGWNGAADFQARDVAVAISGSTATSPGVLQVVANGLQQGELFHRVRLLTGVWTPFEQVSFSQGVNTQSLAMATSDDGYTHVLATVTPTNGSPTQIFHILRGPAGNWSLWVAMPTGVALSATSDVTLSLDPVTGNAAYVAFVDATGNVYTQVRNQPILALSWMGQEINSLVTSNGRTVSASQGPTTWLMSTRASPQ